MPPELANAESVSRALNCIVERWPMTTSQSTDAIKPVFILSAGWRSGSTLLQRLVVSSREVAIWGEPIGEAAVILRLACMLTAFTKEWPPKAFHELDADLTDIASSWIANLTPKMDSFRLAHRNFFHNWLGRPANTIFGVDRWGLKEVRLTIDHARYLKWLFPDARFLFIYRNPYEAYRSWKGNGWYSPWTRYNTRSPIAFTRHWKLLLKGFFDGYMDVDGMVIKFEDLVGGKASLAAIAEHIGVEGLDGGILEQKVPAPKGKRTRHYETVTAIDRMAIALTAGSLMKRAGYSDG